MPSFPSLLRFCILIPLTYNTGQQIEGIKINDILNTIQKEFKGYTKSPHLASPVFAGYYVGKDEKIHRDKLCQIFVDAPEESTSINFFQEFKKKYEEELKQEELYIVCYRITKVE